MPIHINIHICICELLDSCDTFVAFGLVQARNARPSYLLESCRREMQDSRHFWIRAGGKCETFDAFGFVQARNARPSYLLESCRREMQDSRHFWIRAGGKCETFDSSGFVQARNATFLAFEFVQEGNARLFVACGFVQAGNARPSLLLDSCRREMRDLLCFWIRAGAKCEKLVAFAWIGREPHSGRSCWGFSIRKQHSYIF